MLSHVKRLEYQVPKGSLGYLIAKFITDFTLGLLLFVLSLPIVLLAAIAIRVESKGNPFFLQERVGKDGKLFPLVKLRGMYVDAKERFPELYDYSSQGKLNFYFHYDQDPRVTKVGQFIRKTSIDELPNFINVILGQMSLVGPRPEVPDVFEMYGSFKGPYMAVKPGVTCLSKCTGRDSLTKQETLDMDIGYLKRRCFLSDTSILWHTGISVLFRKNVH